MNSVTTTYTFNSNGNQTFTTTGAIGRSDTAAGTANAILGGAAGMTVNGDGFNSGTGILNITKADGGTLVLGGNNAAWGNNAVSINAGTVRIGTATSLGASGGGSVSMSAGTSLEMAGGFTFSKPLNAIGNIRSLSGATVVTSAITLAGSTTIRADAGSLTFQSGTAWVGTNTNLTFNNAGDTGDITVGANLPSGTGTLTKNGASTLTLNGTASAFTGAVTLNGGTTAASVLSASGSNSSIGAGSAVTFTGAGILRYTGTAAVTFNRSLTFTSATGAGIENNGSGTLTLTGAVSATSSTIALAGSNTGFNRFETAILSGANGFAKSGAGRWIVAGANDITGSSPITGGTLVAANAATNKKLVGSPVVSGGAKLQIAKESDNKGRCTYGSLSMGLGATAGNKARLRIGGIATSPTVRMSGNLVLPTSGTVTFDVSGDAFKIPGTYTLVEFASGGVTGGTIAANAVASTGSVYRSAVLSQTGGASAPITVTITKVP